MDKYKLNTSSLLSKKILMAKYKVGLNDNKPVGLFNLSKDLNRIEDDVLY